MFDMNSTAIHCRHANESAISALSIVMVAVIAISIALAAQHIKLPDNRVASKQSSAIDLFPHDPDQSPQTAQQGQPAATELEARFQQAVVMLHAGEYEHAVTALHRVLELSPRMRRHSIMSSARRPVDSPAPWRARWRRAASRVIPTGCGPKLRAPSPPPKAS